MSSQVRAKGSVCGPQEYSLLTCSTHSTCLNYNVNASLLRRREPEPEASTVPLLLSFLSLAHFHGCGKWIIINIIISIMSAIYWLGVMYFSGWASLIKIVKNLPAMQETGFDPWIRKIPWRREWQPTPVFLPREFHGQRSLAGYSPWGHKESDMTEATKHALMYFSG